MMDSLYYSNNEDNRPVAVAISGASGVIYGIRLLRELARRGRVVHWTISEPAARIVTMETPYHVDPALGYADWWEGVSPETAYFHPASDVGAPPASGSYPLAGMVVAPCSGGTLGRLAGGTSEDLVGRMAEVCLKERRPLILVHRETPLSLIHIRNMLTLAEAGATILPASPAFYHTPQSIEDLVDYVVAVVLRQLGIDSSELIGGGWGAISEEGRLLGES
jgi:4-hydroxy-3-polyprenylbenzoate decarboxylase